MTISDPGAALIPAGSTNGRSYSFRDRVPASAHGATYWLEEVSFGGGRVRHGPVRVRA